MKNKFALLLIAFSLAVVEKTLAQDQCAIAGSLFIEPARAKNYDEAYSHYDKVVSECPTYSLAIYQYGEKMFKHFVENGKPEIIVKYEENFAKQLLHFPEKTKVGKNMAKVAQLKYDNKIGTMQSQFDAFDAAFQKDEKTFTSPKGLYTYFSLAKNLFDSKEKDIQEVFNLYDIIQEKINKEEGKYAGKLSELIDKEEEGTKLTAKEEKRQKGYETNLRSYGKIKGSVDTKLGSIADCENLIPLYERNFEEKKNDITWLKSAAGRLNGKDCDTPLFLKMVQQLHSLQPSASSAFYLGRLKEREGNSKEALNYYNQAVDLEQNPNQKVRYYHSIANNFYKKGSFSKAREYYRKILKITPNSGRTYLKIAAMYNKSANNCGNTPFEKRAINWLAAQTANKAARVDPSVASSARKAASSYQSLAPSKSDIFNAGMSGKTITFSCWVGGSVKVPNL